MRNGDYVGLVLPEIWTMVNDVDDLLAAGCGLAEVSNFTAVEDGRAHGAHSVAAGGSGCQR